MQNKFLVFIQHCESKLEKDNGISNIIGYIKLFLVLFIAVTLYFGYTKKFPPELIILCVLVFLILLILWTYHIKLHEEIDYLKGLIDIYNQHIDRITGKWTSFQDAGAEFKDAKHEYAGDLDIVGVKSLFQFLNTTNTWHGRQAFANDLLKSSYDYKELQERQEAIAELSKDIEFSGQIQYYLSKIGTDDSIVKFVDELKENTAFTRNPFAKFLLINAPVITFIFNVGIVIFQQKNLYQAGIIILAMQAMIWFAGILKTRKYLAVIACLPYRLASYSTVASILSVKDFSSTRLTRMKQQLKTSSSAFEDLYKLKDKIGIRHNGILYFIANTIFLWDYQCAFQLDKWKSKYASVAEQWFLTIGEFESLLCLSHLPNVCNHTCLPVLAHSDKAIKAKGIGHPLLPSETRINNDFSCKDNIFIISGSNMSGKTTFLRTIGINMVLARTGGFVCAAQMSFPFAKVVTSMRISDDLNEGVSTFYAELKRIKYIIELASKESNILFLIDEIFRGTNSKDRLSGANTVIKRLNKLGAIGIISTHDLELCELANDHLRIKNCSFSEYYKDNKICFDYKMEQGKSKTSNAKYLMKMVGISE